MKKNRKTSIIFGVGFNDADYTTQVFSYEQGKKKLEWVCPYYRRWHDMLKRCYSPNCHKTQPTYKDCTMCEEWLTFSNFKKWMEAQKWEGKQLDKDILKIGNKEYGPESCVFVHRIVNTFIVDRENKRGEYPLGVYFNKRNNKFIAMCSDPFSKEQRYVGCFDCPNDAHLAWKKRKHELACKLADSEYVDDERVAQALRTRYL